MTLTKGQTPSATSMPVPSLEVQSFTSIRRGWQYLWGEARTRVLLWYVLILGLVFLAGVPAFRYLLFQRIDERVRRDMATEIEIFRDLLTSNEPFL